MDDGLGFNRVRAILQDNAGHFWFGTYGGGVSRYDGDVFRHMRRDDGLPHDRIYDIIEGRNGDVWIATAGGLARYRPNRTPPVVLVTQVIAEERYGPVTEISIPSSQDFVIFEFQAPNLDIAWADMIYRYRLEGFDAEWRLTQAQRVEYTGLPRGDYLFEVEAIDWDLNRSERPATVIVHVHFAYRQIAVSAGLGLAVLLIALQAGRIVRRDRRLRQANLALSAANQQLQEKSTDLEQANRTLRSTQSQLVQAEKVATIGLLAGGEFALHRQLVHRQASYLNGNPGQSQGRRHAGHRQGDI